MPRSMKGVTRATTWVAVAIAVAAAGGRVGRADDGPRSPAAHVSFAEGSAAFETLSKRVKLYVDKTWTMKTMPAELDGLTFTRLTYLKGNVVTVDADAGATVYLIVGDGVNSAASREAATKAGWTADGTARGGRNGELGYVVFKRTFADHARVTLLAAAWKGIVAAKGLDAGPTDPAAAAVPAAPPTNKPADHGRDAAPPAVADVALPQTSINALEVIEPAADHQGRADDDGGGIGAAPLGRASQVVLTVAREKSARRLDVEFAGPVGGDARLAHDEALRFLRTRYPEWRAGRAELSFEDKYAAHDGRSIGAVVGTLVLSAVQGFAIDPKVALTGDVIANGKVRAVGQVATKLRGAAAAHCDLAVIPTDNYDQLVDAVIYAGPAVATDVQVVGADTLDQAVAAVRSDRPADLAEAVRRFDAVAAAAARSPAYLKTPEATARLTEVLSLAPNHLSAKALLAVSSGPPKTLSAAASRYYAFLAGRSMLSVLAERSKAAEPPQVPSSVIRSGLADLRKLRPIADPAVRPLVEAWFRYVQAADDLQRGTGSKSAVEKQRQSLLDEMEREQADVKLMQRMLNEGV